MITLYPGFRFGAIRGVMSASYSFSRGVQPSVCSFTVPLNYASLLDRAPKTMTWTDGRKSIAFTNCIISDVAVSVDSEGYKLIIVSVHDRRWKWPYSQISGRYNVRSGGVIVEGTKKSVRELVELCLKGLGEKNYDIKRLPDDQYPYIDWDMVPIHSALDQLCQSVNYHVALTEKDSILVYPEGFGRDLPRLPSSSQGVAFNFGAVPGKVGIASAPAKWQLDFDLYPVGLDTDGEIRPIWELSYTPKDEDGKRTWATATEPFLDLPTAVRKLAQLTVWRWYQIVPPGWTLQQESGKRFKIGPTTNAMKQLPGLKDKLEIKSSRQFFPLLDHQLDYEEVSVIDRQKLSSGNLDPSMRVRKRPQVFGLFYDEQGRGSDNWEPNLDDDSDIRDKDDQYLCTKSFQIDNDRGILVFSDPMYRLDEDTGERISPLIRLRAAANFYNEETRAAYRVFKTVNVPGAADPKLVSWTSREDVVLEIVARHDYQEDKTVFDPNDTNTSEVEERLDYYLSTAVKKYETRAPAHARYPMLVPYSPDGLIAQVTYEIDGSGKLFTSISKEREEVSNLRSYDERRQALQLKATLDMVAKQQSVQSDKKDGK